MVRPGGAEPDAAKPGVAVPAIAEPDAAEPVVAEPDVARPDMARWRVKPFAGGGEAPASNVVRHTVTVQRPAQVTGVTATRTGNGGIRVNWNATTYPSGRVYYFVDHWNISAGQTADQAVRSAPLDPGTTSLSTTFVPGTRYGFRVFARNIGGFSPASASVEAVA